MKKYLVEIIFYFFLPFALIAVVAEYSIRKIPNDYAYKSEWMTQNGHRIKTLILGPSSTFYDINPVYFKEKGFNASHVSQTFQYDHFIFNKYINQMDSLQNVIIGIDYWSPYGSMEGTAEWWRIKYYTIHYGNKSHKESKYKYELYFHNIGTFNVAFKGLLNLLGLRKESHLTVNEYGYGENYKMENRTSNWNDGKDEALRHTELIRNGMSPEELAKNEDYLADICEISAKKGINVFLINTPLHESYLSNLDPDLLKITKDFSAKLSKKFDNVEYLDFSVDNRFSEDDFYDFNHLNEFGAKKFTLLMDSIIMQKQNSSHEISLTQTVASQER